MMGVKVFSVSLIRDELDIFPYTIDHLLSQDLDGILIADNMSDDGTREMIHQYKREYPKVIHVFDDKEPRWFQAKKMTALATLAHSRGADWILPCDGDEWFRYQGHSTVGEVLRSCPHRVVGAKIWHHFATAIDDPRELSPYKRMNWRGKEPSNLHKVMFRWDTSVRLEAGNHSLHEGNNRLMDYEYGIEMHHYPYRSAEQFLHGIENGGKALRATGFPKTYGGHWSLYFDMLEASGPQAVKDWWTQHFYFERPEDALVYDPIELMVRA